MSQTVNAVSALTHKLQFVGGLTPAANARGHLPGFVTTHEENEEHSNVGIYLSHVDGAFGKDVKLKISTIIGLPQGRYQWVEDQ